MADSDKNILITPNTGQAADPKIVWTASSGSTTGSLTQAIRVSSSGTAINFTGAWMLISDTARDQQLVLGTGVRDVFMSMNTGGTPQKVLGFTGAGTLRLGSSGVSDEIFFDTSAGAVAKFSNGGVLTANGAVISGSLATTGNITAIGDITTSGGDFKLTRTDIVEGSIVVANSSGNGSAIALQKTGGGAIQYFRVNTDSVRFGAGGFTANNGGGLWLCNGATDTPGIHFAYNNNANFGIDVANSKLRFVKDLDEATGAVLMDLDTSGNLAVTGTVVSVVGKHRKSQTNGSYESAAIWTESYDTTTTGIAFHISGVLGKFLEMRPDGILYWGGEYVWHGGNFNPSLKANLESPSFYNEPHFAYGNNYSDPWGGITCDAKFGGSSYGIAVRGASNFLNSVFIGGSAINGFSNYQWDGATYRNPGDYVPAVYVRYDNATTGLNGFKPALTLYNNHGGDQTTVGLEFASAEAAVGGGNGVALAGITAKKEIAGNAGSWTDGSLTFWTKNGATRIDALSLACGGAATFVGGSSAPQVTIRSARSGVNNGSSLLVQNDNGDHSWGIVAEFRVADTSNNDRPSILFSKGGVSTTWSVGYGDSGTNEFRIKQDHGHRNAGWGTERFRIDTNGNNYANGLRLNGADTANTVWQAAAIGVSSDTSLRFGTGGSQTTRLSIDASGNIAFQNGSSITYNGNNVCHFGYRPLVYEGFTLDANTMPRSRSGFSYSVNCPATGPIVLFDSNGYDLQFNGDYNAHGLYFRVKNGDNGTWMAWKSLWHSYSRDIVLTQGQGGNYGNRLLIGTDTASYTQQDGNFRPTIYVHGQYPVLVLNHTVTSNTNHGPTIQFAHNGYGRRQWVLGSSGDGVFFDVGYSNSDLDQGAGNYNPHNGIANYYGRSAMRFYWDGSNHRVGINMPGATPGDMPGYALDVRGNGYVSGVWTVGAAVSASGSVGAFGGRTILRDDCLEHHTDASDGVGVYMNYYGYAGGTSYYRDFGVYNGKTGLMTLWDGSAGKVQFYADVQLYAESAGNSPKLFFGSEVDGNGSFKGFYLNSYWLTARGHYNEGFKWEGWNPNNSTCPTLMTLAGSTGNLTLLGSLTASDVTATSDERVKENIFPIRGALERVCQLQGVTYTKKNDPGRVTKMGVVAQQVLPVVPEVVSKDTEGMLNVAYGNLAGLFIEAFKEMKQKLDAALQEIESLKSKAN